MPPRTFRAANPSKYGQPTISLRCPACLHLGALDPLGSQDVRLARADGKTQDFPIFGHRRCPRTECYAYILVVYRGLGEVVTSFPAEVIDFDASGLPDEVRETLEEAIQCHAHECYRAAAIMVRRTLEVVCADRKATGKDLRDRLSALGNNVILPKELLDGLDALRLLGNDAAHVESQTYMAVGKEEVEVGLAVAKEVLKAVYQLSELVDRLNALKRSP